MRFSIRREAFLKPLKSVAGVVERRHLHDLPILSHVLIQVDHDRLRLTATDQEVELIATGRVEEPAAVNGRTTVSFRKLMDLCRTLPEDASMEFLQEGERVIIRSGRSRFTLSTLPADDFPKLEENTDDLHFTLTKPALAHLLDSTCFAMAEQDVRYYLNGMLLEIKEAGALVGVAADGHRLAVNTISGLLPFQKKLRIIVPRKGILEVQRLLDEGEDDVSLWIGTNHLRVSVGSVILTTKLLDGRFPEYERIIPVGGTKIVQGDRETLKEAFHRAAALFTDKFRGVRLKLTSGILKILAVNTEHDEVEEDVEVDYSGEELDIGFNIRYLIDFLNVIPTETVQFTFSDADSSAKVEGVGRSGQGTYVIMPMRL